jgi:TetR/AcrR family transcriptional regulator, regulator of cefoperazone and chloramphenicol sensitivity
VPGAAKRRSRRPAVAVARALAERGTAERGTAALHRADAEQTRLRLLDAAGEVFAEHGFERATVRDICRRADANIAAVNYHFGGKQQLYHAALEHWFHAAARQYPFEPVVSSSIDSPKRRLHAFVRAMLYRMLGPGKPAWHGKLAAREMVEPTGALDQIVARVIEPVSRQLHEIVCAALDDACECLSDIEIDRCVLSVISQCVFYKNCQPVLERCFSAHVCDPIDIEAIAEHIARFSYAGLQQLANDVAGRPGKIRK